MLRPLIITYDLARVCLIAATLTGCILEALLQEPFDTLPRRFA